MRLLPRSRSIADGSLRRYLGSNEHVLTSTRQHPLALVGALVEALALIVPLAVATWGISGLAMLPDEVTVWVVRIAFVVMLTIVVGLAWSVVRWEFERIVITDEKVIHVSGVLARRIASTPLTKVSELTVRQPLLGRVFDYGSLVVDVPGGRDSALHGVSYLPDPTGVYRLVSDQARRGRTREGGGSLRVDSELPVQVRPDPWQPVVLSGDDADHTISIPRVPPPSGE